MQNSIKRWIDLCVSSLLLIALSPIMILAAIAIKLDSKGPIFYSSIRIGKDMKAIRLLKFRTMKTNSDSLIKNMMHMNSYEDTFVKIKNDPRITRVGSVLRKTSIDELPQFINVILGEMSIVGNRPLPVYEAKKLISERETQRFYAPAGITGLWQTSKRKCVMSSEERLRLDNYYAKKNNLFLDLKIIVLTPFSVIQDV